MNTKSNVSIFSTVSAILSYKRSTYIPIPNSIPNLSLFIVQEPNLLSPIMGDYNWPTGVKNYVPKNVAKYGVPVTSGI